MVVRSSHRNEISVLQWSQYGGRLVSADRGGAVIGWKIDSRGQLVLVFHHELRECFCAIAFKNAAIKPAVDMRNLAKAAVAGDEKALDLFSSWRPRTAAPTAVSIQKDNHAFYIGAINGTIFYVDSQGQCTEVLTANGALHVILHHHSRDSIVIMTEGLSIAHYHADGTGRLTELTKVNQKLLFLFFCIFLR